MKEAMKRIAEQIKIVLEDAHHRKKLIMFSVAGLVIILAILTIQIVGSNRYPKELYIDTTEASVASRLDKIDLDAPYYNKRIRFKTTQFYKQTQNKTKWLEWKQPKSSYKTFVNAIADAQQYGLNPEHYHVQEIQREIETLYDNKKRTPEEVAELDIKITAAFFLFTTHLIEGRIRNIGYGDFIWKRNVPKENDIKLLKENSSGQLSEIIEALHPPHEQYEKLRKALLLYRKLEQEENTNITVSNGIKRLKPGTRNPMVPKIRKKLCLTDIKPYSTSDSLLYDDKMVEAVKLFQSRHGLITDGIISEATMKRLNQSFKHKADLIELNLERIRWLPHEYGEDYITINVPEYMLRVIENGKKMLEMRVVLGSEFNATPIFNDTLEYIVFSPTWNVPKSILKEEMIPDLQSNPLAYDPERFVFYKNGEEIHPEDIDWQDEDINPEEYQIVERPGEKNSLGQVKFVMPNNFNIYMHDTPAEQLFKKNKRAYSHGCIRLEKPIELAKYLLRDNSKWNEEKILEAMESNEPITVPLKKKYHVEIEYRTVWVDDNGLINFREDVYGHDKRQLSSLNRLGGV
jgi:L,D-transpeptidase YcbB